MSERFVSLSGVVIHSRSLFVPRFKFQPVPCQSRAFNGLCRTYGTVSAYRQGATQLEGQYSLFLLLLGESDSRLLRDGHAWYHY
jgi:hypothetical protein